MLSIYKVRQLCKISCLIGIFITSVIFTVLQFSTGAISKTELNKLFRGGIVAEIADYVRNNDFHAPPTRNDAILQNLSRPLFRLLETEDYMDNETNFFRLSETVVSHVPDKFSIEGSSICHHGDVDLLIFIMSVVEKNDTDHRMKIRKTWASSVYDGAWQQTSRTRLFFFFGDTALNLEQKETLRYESDTYGDVVVGQFNDSYANLSLKMVSGLTWVVKNCPQVRHLAKIDMDTYVNIPVLTELTQAVSDNFTEYVLGYKHMIGKPPVLRTGRWAVSNKIYPLRYFPRYLYGHAYVISGPALRLMVKSFPYFNIVPNEDAFITGVMPKVLNITRLESSNFAFLFKDPVPTYCDLAWNGFAASIYIPSNLDEIWRAITTRECIPISIRIKLNYTGLIAARNSEYEVFIPM